MISGISQSAKSSAKMKSPSQFIRYPLEDFLDMYKKKYPDKTPDEWTKIDNLVDEVFRRAYEDTAPPEVSLFTVRCLRCAPKISPLRLSSVSNCY